ncbi:nuclear transport factor 2 family protein [Aurantiacibacter aquimixticola]|uniref:Nuclear transport factor 2 family protein n=1 Tax=Aurantiacibacter aquimixticola TaxID=1958945 RepID=A0A419RQV3_9SPHN|nr:nuclear transport factor 2 family protein [Aurantiacibacter aquimixticola]RJY08147.1 nuclear transport factor 2 family protein [Aurantiacibacter aquimixticola]
MFGRNRKKSIAIVRRYIDALNRHDAGAMIHMHHPEFSFIDARGDAIEGKARCAKAVHALMDMDEDFGLEIKDATVRGGQVLLRGRTRASDPRLEHDMLWAVRVENGLLKDWQSFGDRDANPMAHLLLHRTLQPAG